MKPKLLLKDAENCQLEMGEMSVLSADDLVATGLGDPDVMYAMRVQPGFAALRQSATLLTGILLLDLTECDRTVVDVPLHDKVLESLAEAWEAVHGSAPHGGLARLHRDHMKSALRHLERAADIAARAANVIAATETETLFSLIALAWQDLRTAARLIAGFDTIDLSQSCCAYHAKQIASAGY